MATYYLTPTGGNGTWSSSTNWSSTSGGAGGAGVPGSGDTAYLNAASGSASIAISANTSVGILDMTGFTGTFSDGGHIMQISLGLTNGYLTYGTGMTLTLTGTIQPANTSGTCTFTDLSGGSASLYSVRGPSTSGANLNFGSNVTFANAFVMYSGNVNTQGYNLTTGYVSNSASGFTFNFSNSTITLTGTVANSWNPGTGSITSTGSTITYPAAGPTNAPTFTGGGYTYNNLTWNYTGSGAQTLTITGSNTFNNFTVTTTSGTMNIKTASGTTNTVTGTFTIYGASGHLLTFNSQVSNAQFTWNVATANSPTYITWQDCAFKGAAIPINALGAGNTGVRNFSGLNLNANYDIIQQTQPGVGTSSTATSPAIATKTGHTLIAVITENATGNTWTVSDSATGNNTWTQAVTETNTNQRVDIWYAKNITGNAAEALVVSSTGTTTDMSVTLHEAIGLDLSSPLDKTAVGAATGTNPVTASTAALSQAQEVVISGLISSDTTNGHITGGTGYYYVWPVSNTANYVAAEYKNVNATTAITGTWSDSTSATYAVVVATFKYTASSSGHYLTLLGVGS